MKNILLLLNVEFVYSTEYTESYCSFFFITFSLFYSIIKFIIAELDKILLCLTLDSQEEK